MESVEKRMLDVVENEANNIQNAKKYKEYVEASEQFKTLIEKGFVEPRGNHLLSVDEAHLKRFTFNSSL